MTWLLSWLWQTTLLVVVVDTLLRLQRKLDPSARYAVWLAVLCAVVAWPLVAPGSTRGNAEAGRVVARLAGDDAKADRSVTLPEAGADRSGELPTGAAAATTPGAVLEIVLPAAPSWLPFAIASVWFSVTAIGLAAVFRGCAEVARLKRGARPMPEAVAGRLPGWRAERARGREVSLSVSSASGTPVALGLGRGNILIPDRLLDELRPDELDQVVLHELAHLRRRDDWTGLAQAIAQALGALHPAVWWIGRCLDLEREAACDAFVVRRTAGTRAYALCLTKVAALSQAPRPILTLASGATRDGRQLTERVARLLVRSAGWSRGCSAGAGLLTVLAGSTVAGVAAAFVSVASPMPFTPMVVQAPLASARLVSGPRAKSSNGLPHTSLSAAPIAIEKDKTVPPIAQGSRVQGPIEGPAPEAARPSESAPAARARVGPRPNPVMSRGAAAPVVQVAGLLEATPIGTSAGMLPPTVSMLAMGASAASGRRSRWLVFADAGASAGTGVKDAGVATADFFAHVGRSVAAAF